MKSTVSPYLFPEASPEGPWGVNTIGSDWYVINRYSLRAKRIGRVVGFKPVSQRNPDYFSRALEEAHRRNTVGG